jgi:hypothetical protein
MAILVNTAVAEANSYAITLALVTIWRSVTLASSRRKSH